MADKEKMDESYKPGQQLVKGPRQFDGHNDDGFYDDDDDGDLDEFIDDEDEDDEERAPFLEAHGCVRRRWRHRRLLTPQDRRPCPCCIQPNEHDFICPEPTPDPDINPAAAIPLHHPNPGHAECDNCGHSFPNAHAFGSSCAHPRFFPAPADH